jgi:hypothetical protein
VKLIFSIGAVTTPSEQPVPLAKLYIASAAEQTAPFPEAFRCCLGGFLEALPGGAILLNGITQNANREIGVPGVQAIRFAATVPFPLSSVR